MNYVVLRRQLSSGRMTGGKRESRQRPLRGFVFYDSSRLRDRKKFIPPPPFNSKRILGKKKAKSNLPESQTNFSNQKMRSDLANVNVEIRLLKQYLYCWQCR